MSAERKKIKNLTEKQYEEYVAALKDDPALYNADGSYNIPGDTCKKNAGAREKPGHAARKNRTV